MSISNKLINAIADSYNDAMIEIIHHAAAYDDQATIDKIVQALRDNDLLPDLGLTVHQEVLRPLHDAVKKLLLKGHFCDWLRRHEPEALDTLSRAFHVAAHNLNAPLVTVKVPSADLARRAVAMLLEGAWFTCEPYPDGEYAITVKPEWGNQLRELVVPEIPE